MVLIIFFFLMVLRLKFEIHVHSISRFYSVHSLVCSEAFYHIDRKHVVFGKLVHGHEVLKKIENVGDEDGSPTVTVKIINCGELNESKNHGATMSECYLETVK
jgi:cyclophilin family peptidyl-prolyl cis-trans isomerase